MLRTYGTLPSQFSSSVRAHLSKNYDKTKRQKRHRELQFIFQYRSRGDARGNQSFEISSFARAYVRINDEKTKEMLLRISRGLWENMISSSAHPYFCINYEKEERKLSFKSFTWSGIELGASLKWSISVGDSTDKIAYKMHRYAQGKDWKCMSCACACVCLLPLAKFLRPVLASELVDCNCTCVVTQWGLEIWECCGGSSACHEQTLTHDSNFTFASL